MDTNKTEGEADERKNKTQKETRGHEKEAEC